MGQRCLLLLQAAFISTIAVYGCTVYQKPRPIYDVPFQERSQSKVDGEVRITVAVLSAEESRQLFGVNLVGKDIQPVWVRVQNLTGDPYFTVDRRAVLMFDRRPHSFKEIQRFDWEQSAISSRLERLETDRQPNFDGQ